MAEQGSQLSIWSPYVGPTPHPCHLIQVSSMLDNNSCAPSHMLTQYSIHGGDNRCFPSSIPGAWVVTATSKTLDLSLHYQGGH